MEGNSSKERPERKHDDYEQRKTGKGTGRRRAPTTDRGDREHNSQCLDGFDKRAQECRCYGGGCRRPNHPVSMQALGLVWNVCPAFGE